MAENASNAAVSGGLAVENDENGGGLKKHAEPEAKPARNGDARSNGHDRPNKPARKRRTKLDLEILAYDQANPGKSLDHLRKKFGGRTKDALAELLGRAL